MRTKSKSGFTIIEAILILAIIGLIVMIVFIVLPMFQQSQDETTRRNDISMVYKALVRYQTDNSTNKDNLPQQGSYSALENGNFNEDDCNANSACKFIRDYINTEIDGDDFTDPDGTPYSLIITGNYSDGPLKWDIIHGYSENDLISKDGGFTVGTDVFSRHTIFIIPGGKCDGATVKKSNKRHFAILYLLGEANVYCLDDRQE